MRLADWLAKEGMTQQAFADLIGVTQGRVSQICLYGTGSLATAAKIVDACNGEVSFDELAEQEAAQ